MIVKLTAVFDSPDMADICAHRLRGENVPFRSVSMEHIRPPYDIKRSALNEVNILYPYPVSHSVSESYSINGQNTTLSMRAMLSSGWGVKAYPRDGEARLTVILERVYEPRAREIIVAAHGHSLKTLR